jgi:predicted nucleic acid-binding protein
MSHRQGITIALLDGPSVCSATQAAGVIGDADELIELLALAAIVVTPTETVEVVRDSEDDRLIEAAMGAHADVIVTGGQDLLTLERVNHTRILTPREFLATLQPDT